MLGVLIIREPLGIIWSKSIFPAWLRLDHVSQLPARRVSRSEAPSDIHIKVEGEV